MWYLFFFTLITSIIAASYYDVKLLMSLDSQNSGAILGAAVEIYEQCAVGRICVCASPSQGEEVTVLESDTDFSSFNDCLQSGVQESGLQDEFTLTAYLDDNPANECLTLINVNGKSACQCYVQDYCGPNANVDQFASASGSVAVLSDASTALSITNSEIPFASQFASFDLAPSSTNSRPVASTETGKQLQVSESTSAILSTASSNQLVPSSGGLQTSKESTEKTSQTQSQDTEHTSVSAQTSTKQSTSSTATTSSNGSNSNLSSWIVLVMSILLSF